MSMILFIWFIGWGFSIGVCLDDTRVTDGLKAVFVFSFAWPLMLGCFIRDYLNTGKI